MKNRIIIIIVFFLIISNIFLFVKWKQEKQRGYRLINFDFSKVTDSQYTAKERLKYVYLASEAATLNPAGIFAEKLREFETEETVMLRELQTKMQPDTIENMVYIPAGSFLYGGFGKFKDEPKDTMLSAYYIDKFLVTNQQFVKFLNDSGNRITNGSFWYDLSVGYIDSSDIGYVVQQGFENFPVVAVSWYGALTYAKSINKRLPTKEEWEKAARGVYGRFYPWGSEFKWQNCNSACYWVKYNMTSKEWEQWYHDEKKKDVHLTPIDKFPQGVSPYGCYDMCGNVWQWTSNAYWGKFRKTPRKINRGGNFLYGPNEVQCMHRGIGRPGDNSVIVGFRCAKDVE